MIVADHVPANFAENAEEFDLTPVSVLTYTAYCLFMGGYSMQTGLVVFADRIGQWRCYGHAKRIEVGFLNTMLR